MAFLFVFIGFFCFFWPQLAGLSRPSMIIIDGPSMNIIDEYHWWMSIDEYQWMSINEYQWISSSLKSSSLKKQWKTIKKTMENHNQPWKTWKPWLRVQARGPQSGSSRPWPRLRHPLPLAWDRSHLAAPWPGTPATWTGLYAFRIKVADELVIN